MDRITYVLLVGRLRIYDRVLSHLQDSEGLVTTNSFRLHGLDGWLAACATTCREGDADYAVISLAAAESFPEGVLEGVVAHWGCAGVGRRGGWETPPAGWTTDASDSHEAGKYGSESM